MERTLVDFDTMQDVAAQFQIEGPVIDFGPYGTGHINDTFAVVFGSPSSRRYIFQRINHTIFTDVDGLMENITRVTEHIHAKLDKLPGMDPERTSLTVIPTRDGRSYCRTDRGDYWRAYIFIEKARTYDVLESREQAYQAAKAFGAFQKLLADLPAPPLHEIIPFFHHTPRRFATLRQAIAQDAHNRAAACRGEIDFALGCEPWIDTVTRGIDDGTIPLRVTHNDTKINNVMLDDRTGEGVCVIDFDTIMPGSVLYDFGDEIRTSSGHFMENETDLSKVVIDLDFFDSLAKGYIEEAREFLGPRELELLPFSGMLITFTIGVRFLTDYLQGDVYFKIHHPDENLDRTRTQFEFVKSIQAGQDAMAQIVKRYM